MSLNVRQLRDFVVRPVLAQLGLPGARAAEQLVLGTAAQESGFEHIDQLEPPGRPAVPGPALGLWQMERLTFNDMWDRFLTSTAARRELRAKVAQLLAPSPAPFEQLCGNLYFAAALCRIRYYERPFRLQEEASVDQLAAWWKAFYNTEQGKGTPAQFIASYRRLVEPVYR